MKAGIGLITDDRKLKGLVMGMSIADNIVLPVLKKFMILWLKKITIIGTVDKIGYTTNPAADCRLFIFDSFKY